MAKLPLRSAFGWHPSTLQPVRKPHPPCEVVVQGQQSLRFGDNLSPKMWAWASLAPRSSGPQSKNSNFRDTSNWLNKARRRLE